jgi:hypothetical protein
MISRKELIRKDEEKFRPVRKILPSGKLTLVRQLITSKVLRNYLGHLPYGGFGNGFCTHYSFQHFQVVGHHGDWGNLQNIFWKSQIPEGLHWGA